MNVEPYSAFRYADEPKDNIPCNLCGSIRAWVLARRAASGMPVTTRMCKRCGLIYISPRMTKEGYDRYYKYFYRNDRTAVRGHADGQTDPETGFNDARKFGIALGRRIGRVFHPRGLTIDVGSSTGGVLAGLRDVFPDIELLGIEPSLAEAGYANAHGITTHVILFEDFLKTAVPAAENIICVRSLNHLLDPKSFFRWAFDHLAPEGYLMLVVKNFRGQARRAGAVRGGVQIDHPYMFTPETLGAFIKSVGFAVVYADSDEHKTSSELQAQRKEGLSIHHLRIVGQKPAQTAPITHTNIPLIRYSVLKLRMQFLGPLLKLYYMLFHAGRTSRLRALLRIH